MFIKIPFESTIEFKTNISEITKMSLEHDFNVNEGVVLGNFYISGEYRVHEVSVNKEPFKYTLPFTVEITDRIKEDTLEFNIEDFSYDVIDNNKLKVNIEYSLKASEQEDDLFERVDEAELEDELNFIDDFLDKEDEDKQIEEEKEIEVKEEKETEEIRENSSKEEVEVKEDKKEEVIAEDTNDKERLTKEEEKTIMETIKSSDDTFVTYHVHIVREGESIETISSIYNVPSSLIMEYNDFDNLSIGDKVLIPKSDE